MITQLTEKVTFIYADDDKDDHRFLEEALNCSSLKYDYKPIYDGQELIEFLNDSASTLKPAFLVVDLHMPKMDGFKAIKCIKNTLKFENLPIYTLSTSVSAEDRHKARELGVRGFYTKPIKTFELRDIIEEMYLKSSKLQ